MWYLSSRAVLSKDLSEQEPYHRLKSGLVLITGICKCDLLGLFEDFEMMKLFWIFWLDLRAQASLQEGLGGRCDTHRGRGGKVTREQRPQEYWQPPEAGRGMKHIFLWNLWQWWGSADTLISAQ